MRSDKIRKYLGTPYRPSPIHDLSPPFLTLLHSRIYTVSTGQHFKFQLPYIRIKSYERIYEPRNTMPKLLFLFGQVLK